jgi:hypothetical protein
MKMLPWTSLLVASLLVSACSGVPHKIDSEEFDSAYSGNTYSNLLVIGVYQDRAFRISGESVLSEELKSRGISASPSYDLIPDTRASTVEIQRAVQSGAFDGVLTVATLDPGYDYDAGDYMATRGMVYMLGGEPGAGTDLGAMIAWAGSGLYTLHVGLWDAETGKPIWQATTNSADAGSDSEELKALADVIAEELKKKGLL